MTRPIFITARPQPIPRWLEAFPNALLVHDQGPDKTDLVALENASVLWLHATADDPALSAWLKTLRIAAPNASIVVLSNVPEDDQGMAALAAGASGYCSALSLPAVLHQVASVVEHGGLWVGPQLMRRLMQGLAVRNDTVPPPALDSLSQRERQVAEAVARGSTNKEIARVMHITERTVKAHLTASFEKLGVRDRMQLSLLVNGVEDSTHLPQKISA
ncbi:response regulator transcription factor [Thiobacillus sp.]|uniref:response regulator transcription factor n=1 Tax=Thiobacillus sp. TaxID=924 RepID=UPI0025DA7908|nr:response regulator transcription factor [Thiobacillus sp.]MBT9541202.1 response regulator transcription factor [Thiobacillus sp.]